MRKGIVTIIIALILSAGVLFSVSGRFFPSVTPVNASSLKADLNSAPLPAKGTPVHNFRVVNVYPHDPDAFTQGLIFHKGYIYEGTGLYGHSRLRKVDLKTGRILQEHHLPAQYFGEGITICRNRMIQLTWQSHTGFIYDSQSFRLLGTFSYPTEGWGITCDGRYLIMSDGTSVLRFLDPQNFNVVRLLEVRDRGQAVSNINELEYIKGEIYANIWDTGFIAKISLKTGQVSGWIDLRGLYQYVRDGKKADILNGIAHDAKNDRLYVTGKFWPKLFEIRIEPAK